MKPEAFEGATQLFADGNGEVNPGRAEAAGGKRSRSLLSPQLRQAYSGWLTFPASLNPACGERPHRWCQVTRTLWLMDGQSFGVDFFFFFFKKQRSDVRLR